MWLIRISLFVLLVPQSLAAAADLDMCVRDKACNEHNDKGLELYKNKHYEAALAEFSIAYKYVAAPELLLSIGRIQFHLGKFEEALANLQQCQKDFVQISDEEAVLLKRYIREAQEASQREAAARSAQSVDNTPSVRSGMSKRIAYSTGFPLLIGGVATVALGAAFLGLDGRCVSNDPLCRQYYDTSSAGIISVSIGSAATIAGITLVTLGARSKPKQPNNSSLVNARATSTKSSSANEFYSYLQAQE